ncbi:unnamed protein product [Miscanthus lutarioriparius]|uniref:Uncharacterized protein n=1 Tax=Miscanthus lutarioriparius TaxID=422564 RepID=A0A811N0Z9_9POAL|nr:unnamed protein product [Miscanthus lutarioriparius]
MPWRAVVATLVCFAAFCASVLLFGSFFMLRLLPGAGPVMAAQWKGVRAVAAVFAAVVVGEAASLPPVDPLDRLYKDYTCIYGLSEDITEKLLTNY